MILRPLGQSGYELRSGTTRIIIDPYFSDSVGRLHGRPRLLPIPVCAEEMGCDGVFCTHNHLDHLDPETILMFPKNQAIFTTDEGCRTLRAIGLDNAKSLQPGDVVTVGDFIVTAVCAVHTVEAFGLIVKAEGITLYFSGDTLFDEKLFTIAEFKPDVTLICINGRLGNMNCDEALVTAKAIGAYINIPNHYDMFASNSADPSLFADRIPGGKILAFNEEYIVQELLRR